MATITVTTDGQTVEVSNGDTVVIDIPGGGSVNIVAEDGRPIKVFRIKFVDDSQADTVNIDLSTFTSYGLHIDIIDYDPTDTVNLMSAFGTHVDAGNEDEFQFQYIGANGATFDGFVRAKDNGEKDFTENPPPIVICFASGTIIDTDLGPSPIESLSVGNLVRTRDSGMQPIRWIGKRVLDSLDLARHPQLCPIRFAAGALGNGVPYNDLTVSPQHRLLVSDWRTELHFGEAEVLMPAVGFLNGGDIAVLANAQIVTYYHLLFDQHEIITANGVAAESLHAGDMAMTSLGDDTVAELNLIFPDAPELLGKRKTVRPVARKIEARVALDSVA